MGLFSFLYKNLAIDLGTANTIIVMGNEIVVNEPSIIAINSKGNLIVIGREAFVMHEKTHSDIKTIKPLKDGVIANYQAAELMIRGMMKMVNKNKYFASLFDKVVICIPSGITDVEKRAVKDSAEHTGAKSVYLVYEPLAASIGIGIDIFEPRAAMIIDIGGGTTEIAIIILAGIVCDQSVKIAGNVFIQDIIEYVRKNFNMYIGEYTAEQIKISIGAACEDLDEIPEPINVYGRDIVTGIPRMITLSHKDIVPALERSLCAIEEAVLQVLEVAPPEVSYDLCERGVILTGGGALLRGLNKRLANKIKLNVHIAENPLNAVARGTNIILNDMERYKAVLVS
jgi:rod shape-determining protein MreB